jgi:hypothetical protein
VKEALPFAVFALFVALFWVRGRGNREPRPRSSQTTLSRIVRGDPPVETAADSFVRFGLYAAWLLGLVGIVGNVIELLTPGGVLLIAAGTMIARNTQGVAEQLLERERRSFGHRRLGTRAGNPRLVGIGLGVIGTVWAAAGIYAFVS